MPHGSFHLLNVLQLMRQNVSFEMTKYKNQFYGMLHGFSHGWIQESSNIFTNLCLRLSLFFPLLSLPSGELSLSSGVWKL